MSRHTHARQTRELASDVPQPVAAAEELHRRERRSVEVSVSARSLFRPVPARSWSVPARAR